MLITALVMVQLDAIIFLDKGLFVATAERFWVIACSGGLSWPIFVHLAKLWACLQPPLVPDPLRHGDSADWRRLLPCSVWVGRKDTETSARQIRGTAGQIHTAEEIGTVEQYRGRTRASAKGGRASGSKNQTKKGEGRQRREEGGGQDEGTPLSTSTARSVGAPALR